MNKEIILNDLKVSQHILMKSKDIIRGLMRGGDVMQVEGLDDDICRMLDQTCGIDYFHVYEEKNLTFGVASRTQGIKRGYPPYNTFTVRKTRESGKATELDKRRLAIEKGGIYPKLTLQVFYDKETGEPLSIGIARTEDILKEIDEGDPKEHRTNDDKVGQATFLAVKWEDMKRHGRPVVMWERGAS